MSKREIMFNYNQNNGRTQIDCGDLYNWLLDYDPFLAGEFKKKWDNVVAGFKKDIKKEKEARKDNN